MSGNNRANHRRSRRHEAPSRTRRPTNKGTVAVEPYRDLDDYFSYLGEVVAQALPPANVDEPAPVLCDQAFIPGNPRRGHEPGKSLRSRTNHPERGERRQSAPLGLKARFDATRRHNPAFPWPDATLAKASGLPRHFAAVVVLLHAAERQGCWQDGLDRALFAELAVAHMGVPPRFAPCIVEAISPGGDLEKRGLILPTETVESLHSGHDWGHILPTTVQRFVAGRPSLFEGGRLVRPGGVRAEDYLSSASAEALRARSRRVTELRTGITSAGLPPGRVLGTNGRVRIGWPRDLEEGSLLAAVSTTLGRSIVDGRALPNQDEPAPREQLAATQVHSAVLLIDAEPPRRGPRRRRIQPFPFFGAPDEPPRTWPADVSIIEVVRLERDEPTPDGVIRLDPPDEVARAACWRRGAQAVGFGAIEEGTLTELARRPLYPQEILRIVGAAALETTNPEKAAAVMLRRADDAVAEPTKGGAIVVPSTRLSDVILSPHGREEVEQALAECLDGGQALEELRGTVHDGYGHSPVYLFVGPPGVGKTHTAEAFAGEIGRELRRGTGASLRSKWYGEAEEQIEAWFREGDDAVLFLDEVDGFLKQRSGGETAHHDERLCAVFLAELEKTSHIVLMASNLDFALDGALKSRVRTIRFEAPGAVEREALWRLHLPEQMPGAADVDCARLAKLSLTGRNIKSASYKAYIRARRAKGSVTTALVEEEARREVGLNGRTRRPLGFGSR